MKNKLAMIFLSIGLIYSCSDTSEFKPVKTLYANFNTLLSPQDFAKTVKYTKNENGLWVTPKGTLVTITIPFKNHYLSFGSRYIEQHPQGQIGSTTAHILRYEQGVVTQQLYRLERLNFQGDVYQNCFYVVYFSSTGVFEKAVLFDHQGRKVYEEAYNFLVA